MKQILILILVVTTLLSACNTAAGIEVSDAWARPAVPGQNGAIYFVIRNYGRQADELTGVSSEIADAVEMHESKMEGDVMQMHPLESVPLEPDAEITFAPGGLHIMLVGMKRELKLGDEIEVTLHFRNFEDINVTVPVKEVAASENH